MSNIVKDYIFFSKTKWSEEPRLRHQLAKLVASKQDSRVFFFEKPNSIFQYFVDILKIKTNQYINEQGNILIVNYYSIFHHKISFGPLRHLNEWFKIFSIQKQVKKYKVSGDAVIFNFNYEYCFLKKVFNKNKIISVINDLHWGTANKFLKELMESSYIRTSNISDLILTVSEPLKKELLKLSKNEIEVLYPWGEEEFNVERKCEIRKDCRINLLYWGFVSERIDYEYLSKLYSAAKACNFVLNFYFIGPDAFKSKKYKKSLELNKYFNFLYPMSLDLAIKISSADISMIPYRNNNPEDLVTTFPNKLPRLARACLPIFVSGMPDIISAKFIFKFEGAPIEDVNNIIRVYNDAFDLEFDFKDFYSNHNASSRLTFINKLFS